MKFVLVMVAVLFSGMAHAEVKAPGTFVPRLCSTEPVNTGFALEMLAVKSVCLGKVVGADGTYLSAKLNDGTTQTFQIEVEKVNLTLGLNSQGFVGADFDGRTSVRGEIVIINGIRQSHAIKFITSGNLKFSGNLEVVMTTL